MLQSSSQDVSEWGRGDAGRKEGEGEGEGEGERRLRGRGEGGHGGRRRQVNRMGKEREEGGPEKKEVGRGERTGEGGGVWGRRGGQGESASQLMMLVTAMESSEEAVKARNEVPVVPVVHKVPN